MFCLHALSWHEYFTMHIILDFVLCWFYEWPVMQISNASFPHSAGRHPVLMTRICLRPERVHDSVTIRNSDFQLLYTSLHCLSWRPCGGITIVKAMVRQTQIWPYYGFSCFLVTTCARPCAPTRSEASQWIVIVFWISTSQGSLTANAFMRLAYWIMFQI